MDVSLYFDHNATTPLRPAAREAADRALCDACGNPSSLHGFGRRARALLEECRERLAVVLGVRAAELYFTSGGTESNRLAILGALEGGRADGARPHAIAAAIEHASVLEVHEELALRGGESTLVAPQAGGWVAPAAVAAAVRPHTRVVSIQGANNETGVVQPVAEIARALRACAGPGPLLHVDLVQSLGKVPVDVAGLGADLAAFSSHKLGGPMGAGALWVRAGTGFRSGVRGGPQERRMRPGTEPLPAIAGMVAAAEAAAREVTGAGGESPGDLLARRASERIAGVSRNGDTARVLPNTANLAFDGVDAELLLIRLDREGVAASMGSACASGSREPSHVLAAMGCSAERIRSSVRFSTGWTTRPEDIERLVDILARAAGELRERAGATSRTSRR